MFSMFRCRCPITTDEPSRVPSIETNGSRKEQGLEYGGWGKTSHFSVSKYILTGLVTYGGAFSCFVLSLLVLWPFLLQCSAQTHQLPLIPICCDGFTRFQQLIIHHTKLVPPNAEHNFGTVNIRSGRRRGGMSGYSPWFSALGVIVVDPFFVAVVMQIFVLEQGKLRYPSQK